MFNHFALLLSFCICSLSLFSLPLKDFVQKEDGIFHYRTLNKLVFPTHTLHFVEIESHQWRSCVNEVNPCLWKTRLTLYVPKEIKYKTALFVIGGGVATSPYPPKETSERLLQTALQTSSVVAELSLIPMQPLNFKDEAIDRLRTEDQIIAYSWDKFLQGGDEEWPAQLPMVKGASRAIDALQQVLEHDYKVAIDQVVVTGASKRGWTTWLLAAVDHRVKAIIPLVIDLLNMVSSFDYHHKFYGFWAEAIRDYQEMKIMDRMDTPRMAELAKIVDPYSYLQDLTMPKLIINASGDQFFVPGSSRFYFDQLLGEKHLRYIPNVGHNLFEAPDLWPTIVSFYRQQLLDSPALSSLNSEFIDAHHLQITLDRPAKKVSLWSVENKTRRDFRLEVVGKTWQEKVLPLQDHYQIEMLDPSVGYKAYLVEVTFEDPIVGEYKLTSSIQVLPEVKD